MDKLFVYHVNICFVQYRLKFNKTKPYRAMIRNTYHEHYNRRSSIGSFCKVHMLVRAGKLLPLLFCVCLIIPQAVFAQCPANEADLADGGTFSSPFACLLG